MKVKTKPKIQNLESFAFYQGAHNVPFEDTRLEIVTAHDMERAKLHQDTIRKEKPFEAIVDRLEGRRHGVDAAWQDVLHRHGHHAPSITTAVIVSLLGLAALVVDSLLLGPGFDAVGISDPLIQWAAAFGLAAVSSAIFHMALGTFEPNRLTREMVVFLRALAGTAVVALLAWGVLRGYQVKFGADINHNPLGILLGDHPMLCAIFFCFITLAVPLVGAAASQHAVPRLHDWLTWRRSKNVREKLYEALGNARKKLEGVRLLHQHGMVELDAQQHNWEAIAAQYYTRGRSHGAQQTPHWLVILKATVWSAGGLAVGCFLGPFLAPLYFITPTVTWVSAFIHYRRIRFSPSYDQYKHQEATRFAIRTDRPQITRPPSPRLLPPPEDHNESND